MQVREILDQLERYRRDFPREAVERAIEERERITPYLLQILSKAAENPKALRKHPDYMAHVYAMFLLSQFREKRAYPLIVRFFSQPGDLVFDLTGDVPTEDLDSILASVSGGDDSLIRELIENPHANEYVRGAAVKSLVALVLSGDMERDTVIDYFKSLFREKLLREPSHVWDCLVSSSMDLYPEEVYADIELSFCEGLVDPAFISSESVRRSLEAGKEKTLARLPDYPWYRLIEDTVKEMEWWACFRPEGQRKNQKKKKQKTGRNDPCPCGSGKKYKKCCGRP
jgi:hypothetical protein